MLQLNNTDDNAHIIEWRIKNFSSSTCRKGEFLQCPASIAENLYRTRWVIQLYPRGKENSNFLSCFLRRDDSECDGPQLIRLNCEFSLISFDGLPIHRMSEMQEFKRNDTFGYPSYIGLENLLSRKELLLQSDTLTFRCKLQMISPNEKLTSQNIFTTVFPVAKIATRLKIQNFRSFTKKNPRVFALNDCLSLKVSMNVEGTSNDQTQTVRTEKPECMESLLHIVVTKMHVKNPMHLSCRLKVLNGKDDAAFDRKAVHVFSKREENEEWIFPCCINTEELPPDCTRDDTILLNFELKFSAQPPLTQEVEVPTLPQLKPDPKASTLKEDLKDLHYSSKFSDVRLRIGGETLPAHKAILAARSPKFEEIFMNLSKEATDNEVEIMDIDIDTMVVLLNFIYTDHLGDMDGEKCLLLYSAAQIYRISSLQLRCVKLLKTKMTITDVHKALNVAKKWNATDLKLVVIDYILDHCKSILLIPEWPTFAEENEDLAKQILTNASFKKQLQSEV